MKNLGNFMFVLLIVFGCQKDEKMEPNLAVNQLSFKVNGEVVSCHSGFYWNGQTFSGHFSGSMTKDGIMEISSSAFGATGQVLIDSTIVTSEHVLTLYSWGNNTYTTFHGFLSENQGSGRITIEEVTAHHISGSFEGVLDDFFGRSVNITDGMFQVRIE